jgi:hypothetical protein
LNIISSTILSLVVAANTQLIFDFSAGGLITTVYYIWTACFMIISLHFALQYLRWNSEKPWARWKIALSLFLLTIAVAMEQTLVICFLIVLLFNAYYYYQHRKLSIFLVGQQIITIGGFANVLLCPGSKNRSTFELRWFTNFNDLSLARKIDGGFQTTMNYYTIEHPLFMIVIVLLLVAVVLFANMNSSAQSDATKTPNALTSWGLLTIFLVFYLPNSAITGQIQDFVRWRFNSNQIHNAFVSNTGPQPLNLINDSYYLLFGILLIVIVCQVFRYGQIDKAIVISYILLTAFAGRMIMSFSPTLFVAHGNRTFVFSNILLLGIIGYLLSLLQPAYARVREIPMVNVQKV